MATVASPSSRLSATERADARPFLGQEDEVGTGRCGFGDETLGPLDVVRLRRDGVQLDAGNAQTVGHGRRIALQE
jgi:hypothetical protein